MTIRSVCGIMVAYTNDYEEATPFDSFQYSAARPEVL